MTLKIKVYQKLAVFNVKIITRSLNSNSNNMQIKRLLNSYDDEQQQLRTNKHEQNLVDMWLAFHHVSLSHFCFWCVQSRLVLHLR
jgi:hypothetical protein